MKMKMKPNSMLQTSNVSQNYKNNFIYSFMNIGKSEFIKIRSLRLRARSGFKRRRNVKELKERMLSMILSTLEEEENGEEKERESIKKS